jgi:hypothetical protein
MAGSGLESNILAYQSIVVSIEKYQSNFLLFVKNQGRNIVLIRRILLSYKTATGGVGTLYLRPAPDGITWDYPSAYLESGITARYYTFSASGVTLIQAQAEYIEIDGRSRSCAKSA